MKPHQSDLALLRIIHKAGGTYCFGAEDKIAAEAHRILRRCDRAGWVSVEPTDDGPRVTLLPAGLQEVAP